MKLRGHGVSTDVVSRCAWLLFRCLRSPLVTSRSSPHSPAGAQDRNIWKVTQIKRARATWCVRAIQEPAAMYRSTDWAGPYPQPEPSDRSSPLLTDGCLLSSPVVTWTKRQTCKSPGFCPEVLTLKNSLTFGEWKDWYHSYVCTLSMKLQPAESYLGSKMCKNDTLGGFRTISWLCVVIFFSIKLLSYTCITNVSLLSLTSTLFW